jgi:regulatory protein
MDYLARREHSGEELRRKLVDSGFGREVAADAIERLRAEGLQNDRRFVDAFIRTRINQGNGILRIRADLGQRGISEELLETSLDELDEDWCTLADHVRQRKFGAVIPEDFKTKARQMRFLQSRGFEPGQIRAAMYTVEDN